MGSSDPRFRVETEDPSGMGYCYDPLIGENKVFFCFLAAAVADFSVVGPWNRYGFIRALPLRQLPLLLVPPSLSATMPNSLVLLSLRVAIDRIYLTLSLNNF